MIRSRIKPRHRTAGEGDSETSQVDTRELTRMFAPPTWLQDLGLTAWFLVGLGVALFGLIWLLGETSSIVGPVVAGTVGPSGSPSPR